MTLYTPHRNAGSSRYCGPTAIMAVTGCSGSDVSAAIRQARGHILNHTPDWQGGSWRISGVSNTDLILAMSFLGWFVDDRMGDAKSMKPYRFSTFLAEHGNDGPFIVNVTGHYLAVSHGEVCDASTTILPIEIDRYLKGRSYKYHQSWVQNWWKFTPDLERII